MTLTVWVRLKTQQTNKVLRAFILIIVQNVTKCSNTYSVLDFSVFKVFSFVYLTLRLKVCFRFITLNYKYIITNATKN